MANGCGAKYEFTFLSTDNEETVYNESDSSILSFGSTPFQRKSTNSKSTGAGSVGAKSTSTGMKSSFMTPFSTARNSSRPSTSSRTVPGTGRRTAVSTTGRNSTQQSSVIVALVEGRGQAKGEIGLASVDLRRPVLILCQFPDTQTYVRLITKLSIMQPLEIIMPNTAYEGHTPTRLYKTISDQFHTTNLVTVQRKYFNEAKGMQYIKQLCVPEYNTVEMEVATKYYCLATAAAVLKYVEFIQNIVYAPRSLKVVFRGSEQTTMIDAATVKNLELINNAHNPSSSHSLFGILNNTKTAMGTRLLRANILQPPYDIGTVNLRLDCVTEFTEKEEMFLNLQSVLGRFLDIDHLISVCIQIPKQDSVKLAENRITYIIHLKHVLELLEPLRTGLKEGENPLLIAYKEILSDPRFAVISDKIKAIIHDDTRYQKGTLNMRTQKCFAVKPKINGLLDVARRTYTETVDDVAGLVHQLSERYNLPLKVSYNSSRGFYIQLNTGSGASGAAARMTSDALPSEFVKVTKQKNSLNFVTSDMIRLNVRIRESLNEIYLMTNVVVSQLLEEIRESIGSLHKLSECVAMLDMLVSFTHICTISPNYVKPEFTDTLAIRHGRHPILDKITNGTVVPNNTYSSREANFQVITGPNMSGKSTYLKQIVLIQIMAQIGSYVPAEYASLRLADQIFSRIGSDDDIETNSSTFMLEMKEINYIVQNVTDASIVIIDELGRGTSSEEGVGICFAICEHLLEKKSFTFFATHALELTNLDSLYPNVENYHFEVKFGSTEEEQRQISYTHQLSKGRMEERNYGIQLAETSTLPKSIIEDAKGILQRIQIAQKESEADMQLQLQRGIFQLATHLVQLARNSKLDQSSLGTYAAFLKDKYSWLLSDRTGSASCNNMVLSHSNTEE